jgi:hypothetical protein
MTSNIFGMVGMETPRSEIIAEHKLGRSANRRRSPPRLPFTVAGRLVPHRPLARRRWRLHGRS